MPFPRGQALTRSPNAEERAVNPEWHYVERDFEWVSKDGRRRHLVPAGTPTDFASLPEFLPLPAFILGDPHEVSQAAIIHDDLYYKAGLHTYSRKEVDAIFKEILLEIDVKRWRAFLLHLGVRVGGWPSWRRYVKSNLATMAA